MSTGLREVPLVFHLLNNEIIGDIKRASFRPWHKTGADLGDAPLDLREIPSAAVFADDAAAMKAVLVPGSGRVELERSLGASDGRLEFKGATTPVVAGKEIVDDARDAAV